jgi:hypothetical protein
MDGIQPSSDSNPRVDTAADMAVALQNSNRSDEFVVTAIVTACTFKVLSARIGYAEFIAAYGFIATVPFKASNW